MSIQELLIGETNVDDAHYSKSRSKYEKTEMLYNALIENELTLIQALDTISSLQSFNQWLNQEGLTLVVTTLESNTSYYEYPVYQITIDVTK